MATEKDSEIDGEPSTIFVRYYNSKGENYDGEVKVHKPKIYIKHGMGVKTYKDGSKYDGNWLYGK